MPRSRTISPPPASRVAPLPHPTASLWLNAEPLDAAASTIQQGLADEHNEAIRTHTSSAPIGHTAPNVSAPDRSEPTATAVDRARLAASYARKSDEDSEGIEAQHLYNARVAASDGYTIPDHPDFRFSDDDTRGPTKSRKGLDRLTQVVKRSTGAPFERVYVKNHKRLGRWLDPRYRIYIEVLFANHDVRWCYSERTAPAPDYEKDDPYIVFASLIRDLSESIQASEELREISKKSRLGRRTRALKGFWPGSSYVPYGTERWLARAADRALLLRTPIGGTVKREGCHFVLRFAGDESIAVIKRIFREVVEGRSLRQIARQLTAQGIAPPAARFRHVLAKVVGNQWTAESVREIVRNPIYMGDLVWGRTANADKLAPESADATRLDGRAPVVYPSFVPDPPIERAQFARANMALSMRQRTGGPGNSNPAYLLTGLVRCKHCGAGWHGQRYRPTSGTYYYYKHRLTGGLSRTGVCAHDHAVVRADVLDAAVTTAVENVLAGDQLRAFIDTELARRAAHDIGVRTEDEVLEHLRMEIASIVAQLNESSRELALAQSETEREALRAAFRMVAETVDEKRRALALLECEATQATSAVEAAAAQATHSTNEGLTAPRIRAWFRDLSREHQKHLVAAVVVGVVVDAAARTFEIWVRASGHSSPATYPAYRVAAVALAPEPRLQTCCHQRTRIGRPSVLCCVCHGQRHPRKRCSEGRQGALPAPPRYGAGWRATDCSPRAPQFP
ncbi:MAG: recombinase family protein [Gemmatimonadaceae bacterium]